MSVKTVKEKGLWYLNRCFNKLINSGKEIKSQCLYRVHKQVLYPRRRVHLGASNNLFVTPLMIVMTMVITSC